MNNQMITFTQAQYKYRAFMYDTYQMAGDSVEYPSNEKSYNEKGNWILNNCWGSPLAMVCPNGKVKIL